MAYDSARATTVLFGGGSVSQPRSDTWLWDGTNWSSPILTVMPRKRTDHGLAFDSARGKTVVFGGRDFSTYLNDTWEWDGTAWAQASPAVNPPAQVRLQLAFNSARGKTVLACGDTSSATWEWDGITWTQTAAQGSPPYGCSMAFDSVRRRIVAFGGTDGFRSFGGTLEYFTRGGACTLSSQCDTGLCVDGVCCETTCNGTCMACDTAADPGVCSPVVSAPDPDTCAAPFACGSTGTCGLPKGAPCTGPERCATGLCVDGYCCDTTCTGSCDACNGADINWPGASNGTCANAPLFFPGSPACGAYFCNGARGTCPTSCNSDAECSSDHHCAANSQCQPQKTVGASCSPAGDCRVAGCRVCAAGATCKDGYCCDGACSGACQTCASPPGSCTAVRGRDDTDTCTGTSTCDAAGLCKLKNGQSCSAGAGVCASGFCADGLCCDRACSGGCDVCNATPGTCTVVAVSSPGANAVCAPYLCDGTGPICPTGCTADADCVAGYYCSGLGTCLAQKAQGTTCDDRASADCRQGGCRVCSTGAGRCIDGYCCNAACDGACDACNGAVLGWPMASNGTCTYAPSGFPGSPSCGAFACTGFGPICNGTNCNSDAHCGPAYYCAATHQCVPRKTQGVLCNEGAGGDCLVGGCRVCLTNRCVDGVCCDQACGGGCDVCSKSAGAGIDGTCMVLARGATGMGCGSSLCDGLNGTCPGLRGCTADTDCAGGAYCDPASGCQQRKQKGDSCSQSRECAPVDTNPSGYGYCVDGVCCDGACTNGCSACAAALKANGQDSGTCGPAKAGTDPHATCDSEPQTSCGRTGNCDGNGGCQLWPQNTSCGSGSFCTLNNVTGKVCSGNGVCTDVTTLPCTPYLCQNAGCTSPCSSSAQCDTGYYCVGGSCLKKQDNGHACTSGSECQMGFCVDGVCCDAPCGGQCESCAQSGHVGRCTPVTGTPIKPRADCAGSSPCKGSCNGGDRTVCTYPDQATSCGEASCAADVLKLDPRCDGAGQCASARTQSCVPFGCDPIARACIRTCIKDGDCAAGAMCDIGSGKCAVAGNTCKDAFTVVSPNGSQTSCAPYRCVAGGCQQQCVSDGDCSEGYVCRGSACVRPDGGLGGLPDAGLAGGAKEGKSGCGCAIVSHSLPGLASQIVLLMGAVSVLLRRRRSRHRQHRNPTKG